MEDGHPCNGTMWHPNWPLLFWVVLWFFSVSLREGTLLNATEIRVVLSTVFLFFQGLEVVL